MSINPLSSTSTSQIYTPPTQTNGTTTAPKPHKGEHKEENNNSLTPTAPSVNTNGQSTGQTINTTA